jgi:hypothetical protein
VTFQSEYKFQELTINAIVALKFFYLPHFIGKRNMPPKGGKKS